MLFTAGDVYFRPHGLNLTSCRLYVEEKRMQEERRDARNRK